MNTDHRKPSLGAVLGLAGPVLLVAALMLSAAAFAQDKPAAKDVNRATGMEALYLRGFADDIAERK